jgi:hypothetical protein
MKQKIKTKSALEKKSAKLCEKRTQSNRIAEQKHEFTVSVEERQEQSKQN